MSMTVMQPVTLGEGKYYRFDPPITAPSFETNQSTIGVGIEMTDGVFRRGKLRSLNREGRLVFIGWSRENTECFFYVPVDHEGIYPA